MPTPTKRTWAPIFSSPNRNEKYPFRLNGRDILLNFFGFLIYYTTKPPFFQGLYSVCGRDIYHCEVMNMNGTSMTARMCLFARAYHAQTYGVKVFDDSLARQLLTDGEYRQMAGYLAQGVSFFAPDFQGTAAEALAHVVDSHLSPSPLGRAAFAETSLKRAAAIGARQYILLGAGYDTFACRQPAWAKTLRIFEVDHPATNADKQRRLEQAGLVSPDNVRYVPANLALPNWQDALLRCPGFSSEAISFCSLLGLVYYIPRQAFDTLLAALETLFPEGSSLVFDYPVRQTAGSRARKQAQLAAAAGEPMQDGWSYTEMESILAKHSFLIYEHLAPPDITAQFFVPFNRVHPGHPLSAPEGVSYCLAVRK